MAVSTVGSTISYLDKAYKYNYTISANGALTVTGSQLGFSTPDGYAMMAFTVVATGNQAVVPRNITASAIAIRNLASTEQTGALDVTIRYIKLTVM